MYDLSNIFYSAALRAKAGEFQACSELDDASKDRLLPDFILPPMTAKENGTLTIDGVIESQIAKIARHWG
jgi:hypothetical protein